jgi:hypothetical protein
VVPMLTEGGMSCLPRYFGIGRESKGRGGAGEMLRSIWSRSRADKGCSVYPGGGVSSSSRRVESAGGCELEGSLRGVWLFEGEGRVD